MATATPCFTWEDALQEHISYTRVTRAKKTLRYYEGQPEKLAKWADANGVPFGSFGKRNLDRYVIFPEFGLKPFAATRKRSSNGRPKTRP